MLSRLLVVVAPVMVAIGFFPGTGSLAMGLSPPGAMATCSGEPPGDRGTETLDSDCCWIFLDDKWWCVPCDSA